MEQTLNDFVILFTSILWEAFPFVVLGAFIAGFLEEMVPQQAITKVIPKNKYVAIAIGSLLGLVFPMCECGIVPVMRRLLRKGLPLAVCVAYMLAGPIINVIVILSTREAFLRHEMAFQMVAFRVGMGFVVACITALVVDRLVERVGVTNLLTPLAIPQGMVGLETSHTVHPAEFRAGERRPVLIRLANISETSLHDFVDIMVYLTLGALISAFCRIILTQEDIGSVANSLPFLAILAMMALAILLCLCSEADAFVAASFTSMPPSTKIAFLVLGPMFDLKLLLMYTRVFRRKLILTIVSTVIIQVFVYCMIVHYVVPQSFFTPPPSTASLEGK
ncbi:permease [Telmatocola sphagniphila]|uniref:Permease n=1 Tax=Telmatocola sphagniphila TaxID=1123043 RepID=A0A8E6B777_9BACT|nr:permease [Telmatocola sphagniphila]QVL33390.1 permease [Telmatocola sphagniphila]